MCDVTRHRTIFLDTHNMHKYIHMHGKSHILMLFPPKKEKHHKRNTISLFIHNYYMLFQTICDFLTVLDTDLKVSNIVLVAILALSCLNCSIVRNILILTNIVNHCLLLSSIAQYCPLLTSIVQWCPLWPLFALQQ